MIPGTLTEAGYTVVEYAADALAFTAGAGGTVDHATLRRNQNGLAVHGGAAGGDLTQDSHPVMHASNLYHNGNYHYDARDFADPATVPLTVGGKPLTARTVSDDGQTAELIITITSTAVSPITVSIDHDSGLIPLAVSLTINNPGSLPLSRVISVDFDGDGTA